MKWFAKFLKAVREWPKKRNECPESAFGHRWVKRTNLNSGFWHHGALPRTGHMCEYCVKIVFPETDAEYFRAMPAWLQRDPDLKCPRGFDTTKEAILAELDKDPPQP